MKTTRILPWFSAAAMMAALALPATAQVVRANKADVDALPPQFKGGAPNNSPVPRTANQPDPNKDPRDFNGYYDTEASWIGTPAATDASKVAGGGGFGPPGGGPGGPPPGGPGGPGGGPGGRAGAGPGGANPGGEGVSIASVRGKSFNRESCLPSFETGRGFHAGQIIMAHDTVVLISETNHQHQIIYLNSPHPAAIQTTYLGDAAGHWEGNTLVVDVVGVKNRGHMVERIRKLSNGDIENLVTSDGGAQQLVTLHWRPDLPLAEDVCEDFAEAYGKTYTDPNAPNLDSDNVVK